MLKRSLLLLSLSFIFFNAALFAAGESGWIYVLNRNYNEISVIEPGEKRLIYHIPLSTAGTPIVLNRRGTRFYRSSPDGLAVVYAKTNRIIKNVTFPNGSMTWAFSPDFRYLWGIGLEAEVVVVIDEKKARLVKTLDLASRPQAPIFSADGKKVFLIDKAGVRVIDTRAYKQGEDNLPLLIETEWLVNNLSPPKLKVVDFGRTYKDYEAGHIPGAVYLEQKAVWDRVNGIPGMLPASETVAEALAAAGISDHSSVIIYDGANGLWAARLFWALEYLGHKGVHVLNGGWNRWLQDGGEVQKAAPRVPRGNFTARPRPELLATKEWILRNLESQRLRVVDTRSPKEYSGADARSARGGHIPGSVNINWILNITDQKIFLPEYELAEFYDSRGVEKDKIAVTLCQTGVKGAHTYFVLRHTWDIPRSGFTTAPGRNGEMQRIRP